MYLQQSFVKEIVTSLFVKQTICSLSERLKGLQIGISNEISIWNCTKKAHTKTNIKQ